MMIDLNDSLNIIMNWLQQNQPEFSASFLPGLTDDEINQILKGFDFVLPLELYTLYKWKNGTREEHLSVLFPSMSFLPLADALELNQQINDIPTDSEDAISYNGNKLFIFMQSKSYCAVLLNQEKINSSPIIEIDHVLDTYLLYTSLTSMIQTFAECYETGAYYLDADGFVCEDEDKVAPILRKYNAEILENEDY